MVPVVSDHTWYFPYLHVERGWIAFLQPLNKVMEGAGALHGVGCAGNFCLELGKEGERGAEFSAACRGRQGTLRVLLNTSRTLGITLHSPRTPKTRKAQPSLSAHRDDSSYGFSC